MKFFSSKYSIRLLVNCCLLFGRIQIATVNWIVIHCLWQCLVFVPFDIMCRKPWTSFISFSFQIFYPQEKCVQVYYSRSTQGARKKSHHHCGLDWCDPCWHSTLFLHFCVPFVDIFISCPIFAILSSLSSELKFLTMQNTKFKAFMNSEFFWPTIHFDE